MKEAVQEAYGGSVMSHLYLRLCTILTHYFLNFPEGYVEHEELISSALNQQFVRELTLDNTVLNQSRIYFITTMKERLQKFLHPNVECHANLNLKDVCSLGRVSWKVGSLQ
jgi:hypothetical protein